MCNFVLLNNHNMGKNTEINFVGQPIFKQVLSLIDGISLTSLLKKHNADYYYKAFKAKTQLITVLFGIFSRCDSDDRNLRRIARYGRKVESFGA
jgi:hypothetical protein